MYYVALVLNPIIYILNNKSNQIFLNSAAIVFGHNFYYSIILREDISQDQILNFTILVVPSILIYQLYKKLISPVIKNIFDRIRPSRVSISM